MNVHLLIQRDPQTEDIWPESNVFLRFGVLFVLRTVFVGEWILQLTSKNRWLLPSSVESLWIPGSFTKVLKELACRKDVQSICFVCLAMLRQWITWNPSLRSVTEEPSWPRNALQKHKKRSVPKWLQRYFARTDLCTNSLLKLDCFRIYFKKRCEHGG